MAPPAGSRGTWLKDRLLPRVPAHSPIWRISQAASESPFRPGLTQTLSSSSCMVDLPILAAQSPMGLLT